MSDPIQKHVIGVVGIRHKRRAVYRDQAHIDTLMRQHLVIHGRKLEDTAILTGGGKGAEQLVIDWCNRYGVEVSTIPPNIQNLGLRRAFQVRNSLIVVRSAELIIIWDGWSDDLGECAAYAAQCNRLATIYPV